MDLYNTVVSFINSAKPIDNEVFYNLGRELYMREFRTFMFGVPRRAGKTTTISALSNELSALTYHKYYKINNIYKSAQFIEDGYPLRGYVTKGLKYQCILLDEYKEVPNEIYKIYNELNSRGVTTKDFFILGLYTP